MRDLGITFAGGGNRAFYQQGFMSEWGERLWPRTAAVASCSAGAAIVTLLLSERSEPARQHWDGLRKGLTRNVDLSRALRGERIAPHGAIYRSTLMHALMDGGLARIRAQPFPIYVLCTRPPAWMPMGIAMWLGLGAYELERTRDQSFLHPSSGRRLGYREFAYDARDCETPDDLADLILASSATPPFTPIGRFQGHALLDGGIIDSAPAYLAERAPEVRRNLVLLSRNYPEGTVGERTSRLYVAPSEPVPVARWDYTETARVDDMIALGARDAKRLETTLLRFLD